MDHWIQNKPGAKNYFVELDGKREGETCVEAKASTKDEEGWVRRRWVVGEEVRERRFYGRVFIVRFQ